MNQSRQGMGQGNVHEWTLKRLTPFIAGLLNDAEEQQLRDHLAGCTDCSQRHQLMLEQARDADLGDHIPAGIVASWGTASVRLRGLERAMVQRHLERCADCRRDLEVLGFDPVLEPTPDVVAEKPRSLTQLARQRKRNPWWGGNWTSWTVGATTATAAALTLALLRNPAPLQFVDRGPTVPVAEPPTATVVVDPRTPQPVLPALTKPVERTPVRRPARKQGASLALSAYAKANVTTRGSGSDETELEPTPIPLPGETLTLRISEDLPEYLASSPAQVLLLAPDASVVAQFVTSLGNLRAKNFITFIPNDVILRPGKYTLRFRITPPAPAPTDTVDSYCLLVGPADG